MRRLSAVAAALALLGTLVGSTAGATTAEQPGWTTLASYGIAPGVTCEEFSLDDGSGVVIGHLIRIDPATPGLGFDLASGRNVASRHPVPDVMDADAVAAVNGDFFDIRDTDAPLGVAVDRQRGLRNGVAYGWNDAFWVGKDGVPHIGPLSVDTSVPATPGHPAVTVATVDSPSVPAGAVGLYDRHWGTLRVHRVVDGQRRGVRLVVIRNGRVTANRTTFTARMPVRARVLVGRGAGAQALARLQVGERARTRSTLSQPARFAVTGSDYLLTDGTPVANTSPDPLFVLGLYPRTGVGIDHDTGQVLLVVVDGRSAASRGYSLPEMTALFQRLGAEDALNLDGGGSSIMVARAADGALGVLNTPSDGHPRAVANGLEVTYDAPPAPPPASPPASPLH